MTSSFYHSRSRFLKLPLTQAALIVALGLLVYSNSLTVPFQFDDAANIQLNPQVRDAGVLARSWLENPRFIAYLSFSLNYAMHGTHVLGYHIFNLLVHIFNALLVCRLLMLIQASSLLPGASNETAASGTLQRSTALFTALFFVSHPIETQAVTYIVQRLASLATFFFLCSLVAYGEARRPGFPGSRRSVVYYALAVLSAVFAMKTKEIAFTLPVVMALFEFLFLSGSRKTRVALLLPFFFIMLIIPATYLANGKPTGELLNDLSQAARQDAVITRLDYLRTQFPVIVTYLRLLVLPVDQNLDYEYPIFPAFFSPRVLLSLLLLASILAAGIYAVRRSTKGGEHALLLKQTAFGIFWFFVTLSVESSVIPLSDVIYEHRVYLPSIGFFISVTAFLAMAGTRLERRFPGAIYVTGLLVAASIAILSAAAHARNEIWKSELGLWEDAAKKSPGKARPHRWLGTAYAQTGMTDQAIAELEAAVTIEPYSPTSLYAHYNLASQYLTKGMIDEAEREMRVAIALKPDSPYFHCRLGDIFLKRNRAEEAARQYAEALSLNPSFSDARMKLDALKKRN